MTTVSMIDGGCAGEISGALTLASLESTAAALREEIEVQSPNLARELRGLSAFRTRPVQKSVRAVVRQASAPSTVTSVTPDRRFPPLRWAINLYIHLWNTYPRQRATLHLWRSRLRSVAAAVRRLRS